MYEYVGMYICMEADVHKSLHVCVYASYVYVCIYTCIEVRINGWLQEAKHAEVYICLYES